MFSSVSQSGHSNYRHVPTLKGISLRILLIKGFWCKKRREKNSSKHRKKWNFLILEKQFKKLY